MVRHNNQLPHNLPQLQNLIKRDSESYKDDFLLQYKNFQSTLELFCLSPDKYDKHLAELVMFLAQVVHCYPDVMKSFPQCIINLLEKHNTTIDNEMRKTFCKALILLRNKGLLEPEVLIQHFFNLMRCQDKVLRDFLKDYIVRDIKNINEKTRNAKINTSLRNIMHKMSMDSNPKIAKIAVDIMVTLYGKNIWNDQKTVNLIATACFSNHAKVMVTALKFFLGTDPEKEEEDSDSDDEPNVKEVLKSNRVNKKTKKREKNLKKIKQEYNKSKKKKSKKDVVNFSALHLINDPQEFAEKLFKRLDKADWFEIKVIILDIISKLIGLHQLFLFNFYPYIQRFLQPHQREVTKLLLFVAQASHELLPPDVMESVLKVIVNNFVTERNSTDVIAVGLNAVREICSKCPLAMDEDLLKDLVGYKNYKHKSVMMAARSLITVFRNKMPHLLHRKEKGRPTEAMVAIGAKKYGEISAAEFVPGAEILNESEGEDEDEDEEMEEGSDDEDEWVDISHSEDEGNEKEDSDNEECSDEESDEENDKTVDTETSVGSSTQMLRVKKLTKQEKKKIKMQRLKEKAEKAKLPKITPETIEKASRVSTLRILSDKDFKKIDLQLAKQKVTFAKKGVKRPLEEDDESKNESELLKLSDIENIYKKKKHDKETRMQTVKEGQKDRERFGYKDGRADPFCSKTNREKKKTKAYQMIKHKAKRKEKRSFKSKQIALRNHLLTMKKMK